jgi:hypothetical protein
MPIYSSKLTATGEKKIAEAIASGTRLNITHMAVTDGETEMYRAEVNTLSVVEDGVLFVEMVIPEQVGGFWIHGTAIYDEAGERIADGNLPATYKPLLEEGSGRISTVRMLLRVSSTEAVTLKVDPSVVLATVEYVNNQVREAVQRANDAYELAQQKVTFDEMYPIGDTKFFAKILNPNDKWPGTLWYPLEENKTIRLAKADGSNVMEIGGNDSIKIARSNLPAEEIDVTGDASEHDTGPLSTENYHFGRKETSREGKHVHQGGMGAPGDIWDFDYIVGSDNDSHRTRNYTSEADDHIHTLELEDHKHTLEAIKHKHTITAKTDMLGEGDEINIVNSYITIYGWYRAA